MTQRQTQLMAQMELLYEKFYRRLYLYALTLLGNEEDAKDTVGDVFAAVWQMWMAENAQSGQQRDPNATFLYKATRNRCMDRLRHSQAATRYQALLSATDFIGNEADVADYEERIAILHQAIEQLPEPRKSILWHCYFMRQTYRQAAESLGLTESVVHRHMMKAFKMLREMLKSQK